MANGIDNLRNILAGLTPEEQDDIVRMSVQPQPETLGTKIQDIMRPTRNETDDLLASLQRKPAPVEEAAPSPAIASLRKASANAQATPKAPVTPVEPKNDMLQIDVGEAPDRAADLEQAQGLARDIRLAGQLGQAGETIGSAIARTKPVGTEVFKQISDSAKLPEEELKARIDNEKNDPNSPSSKGYREFLKRFGVEVKGDMTAALGEKLTPFAFKAFEAEENRKSREAMSKERIEAAKDSAKIRAEDKSEREKARGEDKSFKKAQDVRNEINKQTKLNQDIFDERQQLSDFIDEAVADGGTGKGFQDLALTYGFIKSRDNTAVREGEVRLLRAAGSVPDQIKRSLRAALSGQAYDKADLEALKKLLQRENSKVAETYKKRADTAIAAAEKAGLSKEDVLTRPDIYSFGSTRAPASEKSVVKKGYNAKTDQTQIIYSDGTKETVSGRR